jgi:transcriptional regulator of acetoin/glycerol metabolism
VIASDGVLLPIVQVLLDALPDQAVVCDTRGRVLFANQAARHALLDGGAGGELAIPRDRLAASSPRAVPVLLGQLKVAELLILRRDALHGSLADQERQLILQAVALAEGNMTTAARRLGISRTTLWRRLRRYQLRTGRAPS